MTQRIGQFMASGVYVAHAKAAVLAERSTRLMRCDARLYHQCHECGLGVDLACQPSAIGENAARNVAPWRFSGGD
jgi:hypothetical protein